MIGRVAALYQLNHRCPSLLAGSPASGFVFQRPTSPRRAIRHLLAGPLDLGICRQISGESGKGQIIHVKPTCSGCKAIPGCCRRRYFQFTFDMIPGLQTIIRDPNHIHCMLGVKIHVSSSTQMVRTSELHHCRHQSDCL